MMSEVSRIVLEVILGIVSVGSLATVYLLSKQLTGRAIGRELVRAYENGMRTGATWKSLAETVRSPLMGSPEPEPEKRQQPSEDVPVEEDEIEIGCNGPLLRT